MENFRFITQKADKPLLAHTTSNVLMNLDTNSCCYQFQYFPECVDFAALAKTRLNQEEISEYVRDVTFEILLQPTLAKIY